MDKADKMLYQENVAGANLVVLFVVINMVFTIMNLRFMPIDLNIGIFVMYNILLSLITFLASTKMKVYKKKWGYAGVVIAVIQLFRVLNIPEGYTPGFEASLKAMVIGSAIVLVVGSVITIRRSAIKSKYEASLEA